MTEKLHMNCWSNCADPFVTLTRQKLRYKIKQIMLKSLVALLKISHTQSSITYTGFTVLSHNSDKMMPPHLIHKSDRYFAFSSVSRQLRLGFYSH